MTNRTYRLIALPILILLACAGGILQAGGAHALTCTTPNPHPCAPTHITTTNHPDGRCHEDDPCWDCRTMGNRRCGVLMTLIYDLRTCTHARPALACTLEKDDDGSWSIYGQVIRYAGGGNHRAF